MTNHDLAAKSIATALSLCVLIVVVLAPATARAHDDQVIAIANGTEIRQSQLVRLLIDAYGLEIMQQLIMVELSKEEARRHKLDVTPGDVRAEYQYALDKIATESGMNTDEATEENKRGALDTVLKNKNISIAEFMVSMERNAYLRKVARAGLQIDEDTLREEFARTYGERVRIRHIQIPIGDTQTLNEVVGSLARGGDFADLAKRYSRNPETASRGGEMAPFAFTADLDPAFREAAFSLKTGETSPPIRTGRFFHIITLEQRIAPENVRFEDVRDQVRADLQERAVGKQMEKLAIELFNKAKIQIIDPDLRQRYEQFLTENSERLRRP